LVANQDMVHGGFIKGLIDGVTRVIMGEWWKRRLTLLK
jgi:hypothetical protein